MVLIRTEQVAVAAGSLRAYPNGFEFTLLSRMRREDETGPGGDPLERHRSRRRTQVPEDVLRLGVLYADGRRAATATGHPWPLDDVDADRLILPQNGGGGSDRRWDGDFGHPATQEQLGDDPSRGVIP